MPKVKAYRFMANGREVVMKPIKAPEELPDGAIGIVGYRWQWFKNDFAKKPTRLSSDSYEEILWEW